MFGQQGKLLKQGKLRPAKSVHHGLACWRPAPSFAQVFFFTGEAKSGFGRFAAVLRQFVKNFGAAGDQFDQFAVQILKVAQQGDFMFWGLGRLGFWAGVHKRFNYSR
jgi:hypothetical protein